MLTGRQQEIWDFLVDYVDHMATRPPCGRSARQSGWPRLRRCTHISRTSSARDCSSATRRSLGLSSSSAASARRRTRERVEKLPLVGQIAAGGPLLAEENVEDHLAVPETLKRDFLLRVKGESMINAGILDGDLVVVQRAQEARNGEIVVALAGDDESADEATVKRFFRENGRVRLQPENDALEPIYAQHVQILGRVTGVFRSL